MPEAPSLDSLPKAAVRRSVQPPLEGYTFEGYRNPDGSVGTRNILAISTSVQCVAGTVEFAIKRIRDELLPKYPDVDDVIAITHAYGCGVAINAPGAAVPIRTLQNLARNPNFGGEVMIVGLGCEKLQPELLLPEGMADGDDPDIMRMQDESLTGFGEIVASIVEMADKRLRCSTVAAAKPAPPPISWSACNAAAATRSPASPPIRRVGFAADLLVRAGATVMFSEVTEVRDAIHLLTPRAVNQGVADALIREMDWYDRYLQIGEADRSANTTPGNKKGGLSNIVEKAMGSVIKSGTSPDFGRAVAGRAGARKGIDICGDARQRLHLRHAATRVGHDAACLHHRPRHALRPRRHAGHQGLDPQRTQAALARFDRHRRRHHRHRRGDHRGGRLGNLPPDARRRLWPQEDLGRDLGDFQCAGAVQSRPGDVAARDRGVDGVVNVDQQLVIARKPSASGETGRPTSQNSRWI